MTFNQWTIIRGIDGSLRWALEDIWEALQASGRSEAELRRLFDAVADGLPPHPHEDEGGW